MVTGQPPTQLSLHELLRRVYASNLNIAAEQRQLDASRAEAEGAWGLFEPRFVTEVTIEGNRRLNSRERFLAQGTPFFEEDNNIYGSSLEFLSPLGTRVRLGGEVRYLENNLQVSGQSEWDGFAGIDLTQPLLKNFGLSTTLAPIRLAQAQSEATRHQVRGNIAYILSSAESAYWDLYGAAEESRLRDRSVEIARTLLADNRARAEAGRMGELEIYQAEAGLLLRQSQADTARQQIVDASALIRAFLGETLNQAGPAFIPADVPPEFTSASLDASTQTARSLDRHPEYLARLAQVAAEEQRLQYATNQRKPALDLKASYGLNGLGNTYSEWSDLAREGDYPSWYVGLELRLPLGPGIRERADVNAARNRLQGARSSLQAAEADLGNQIAAVLQRIQHLRERVESYRKVEEFQQKLLSAEMTALNLGRSDSRRVLQAEQDLTDIARETLAHRLELQRAVLQLELLNGTYLQNRGLDLAE